MIFPLFMYVSSKINFRLITRSVFAHLSYIYNNAADCHIKEIMKSAVQDNVNNDPGISKTLNI